MNMSLTALSQATDGTIPMEVEFPGLGIELTVHRVALTIGDFKVYWYAVIILVGFILAALYAFKRAKKFGIKTDPMIDVVIIGFICAIVGARLYYVLFSLGERSYSSFWEVINIRDGGLAIYGAVIGAFVSGVITCRWRKIDPLAMFDLAGMGFLIGQCLGRWGNFANQEAFGSATDMPWGMLSANTMAKVPDSPVHPCFLYESLWCLAGFIMLHYISKRFYKFYGQLFLLYLLWYGLGRVWIEGLRTDSLYLIPGVIRVSQLIAGLSLITVPLLVLGFKGKLFRARVVDENGCATNAMFDSGDAAKTSAGADNDAATAQSDEPKEAAEDKTDGGKDDAGDN